MGKISWSVLPGKPFQPSLEVLPFRLAPGLSRKYQAWLERFAKDKRFGIFSAFVSYKEIFFVNTVLVFENFDYFGINKLQWFKL